MASVAGTISYYAYELVTTRGDTGVTARLLPFTVDGLICGEVLPTGPDCLL